MIHVSWGRTTDDSQHSGVGFTTEREAMDCVSRIVLSTGAPMTITVVWPDGLTKVITVETLQLAKEL